jgi:DNA mismatch repair protein MutL
VDGNVKLDTAGDGNLKNTIYAVFGKEFASRMIEVNTDHDGISVHGFIGRTDNFKANRNYQNFFINGRFVKSKTAMAALEQAYTSYMPPEKFPCCVLYLNINPARVDVNVHPAKLEVKFSNEKAVFEVVYYTVRSALEENVTRPSMQLDLGGRRKNPFDINTRVSDATTPIQEGKQPSLQSRQITYDLDGRTQPQPQARMTAEEFRSKYVAEPAAVAPIVSNVGKIPTVHAPETRAEIKPKEETPASHVMPKIPEPPISSPTEAPRTEEAPKPTVGAEEKAAPPKEAPINSPTTPTATVNETAERPTLPYYRIVGEVFRSYVIVEMQEKMLVID